MSHLPRPRLRTSASFGFKRSLASILLFTALSLPVHALPPMMQDYAEHLTNAGIKTDSEALGQTGNYDDCLDYTISAGMYWCPGFFFFIPTGPMPSPCVDFEYMEPNAIVEVNCSGKSNFGGNLAGSVAGTPTDNCANPRITQHGAMQQQFYHAIVRATATPQTRLLMSGSPIQVAQSYTCGIAGVAGNMNMLQNLQNFNFAETLNPANWQGMAQESMQNVQASLQDLNMNSMFENLGSTFNGDFLTNFFTNLGQSIQQAITDFMTSLQDLFKSLETALQGLMSGNLPLEAVNMNDIGTMAQDFLGMGDVMGAAAALQGEGDLLNAAIGATTAGNALQMLTQPGITQEMAGNLAGSVQQALNLGMQGLGLGTAAAGKGKDTFYATNFTPANFAQSGGALAVNTQNAKAQAKPANLEKDGYASWSFLATGAPGGKSGGFLEDGASQVMLNQLVENINVTLEWVDGMSRDGLGIVRANAASFSPAQLCSSQKQIEGAVESLTKLKASLGTDSSPTQLIPHGTFLNSTQYQVALKETPIASCPLTNAGFIANASNPSKLQVVNCTSVCTGGGDEPRVCRIVPKAGFGGSCYTNALSVQKENGLYPACNGILPEKVANGTGGWRAGGGYNATFDHNSKINAFYRNKIMTSATKGIENLKQAKQLVDDTLRSQGGACTALGNPTGPQEWLARTPLPSNALTAQASGVSMEGADVVGDTFAMLQSTDLDLGLFNMTGLSEQLAALNGVGVRNVVNAQIAKVNMTPAPIVLDTSWNDGITVPGVTGTFEPGTANQLPQTHSGWAVGRYTDGSDIFSRTWAALDANNGLVGEMATCSSKLLLDMMPTSGNPAINSTACWGNTKNFHGYTTHKTFGPHTIADRAHNASIIIHGVPKDTSGKPMQIDVTQIEDRQEATTQGLPALGTGTGGGNKNSNCHPVGSLNPELTNSGSNPIKPEDMFGAVAGDFNWAGAKTDTDNGSLVITYWKNTKCCIPPACPYNMRKIY